MFKFDVMTTTRAHGIKFVILFLNIKAIAANKVKAHFSDFVKRDRHGTIAKHLTCRKVIFQSDVFLAVAIKGV